MGTPMNQLVRRFLSPNLAPKKLFSSPRSPVGNTKNGRAPNSGSLVRSLKFPGSPLKKEPSENFLGVNPFWESSSKSPKIFRSSPEGRINFSNLVVDTPERGEIFESGLKNQKVAVLGKGNFGTVALATYKSQKIIVKVINLKTNSIQSEKNALKLKHENVVETHKIFSQNGKNFGIIFMEYLPEAKNLHEILHNEYTPIPRSTILKWTLDITRGLQYCHSHQILHLDLKPKNILLTIENSCKICDFGNSFDINNPKTENIGTVGYTAPEIFQGKMPTEKSDVYSLGVTFWQMENRRVPYEGVDCQEVIIYEVVKNNLRPPLPKCRTDFTELYERCWSPKAEERPDISRIRSQLELF